jgi:hypothetical protein
MVAGLGFEEGEDEAVVSAFGSVKENLRFASMVSGG